MVLQGIGAQQNEEGNHTNKYLVGALGSMVSQGLQWISRKAYAVTQLHVGHALKAVIPATLIGSLISGTQHIQTVIQLLPKGINWVCMPHLNDDRLPVAVINRRITILTNINNILVAPILEEVVYRGLINNGIPMGLEPLGINSPLVKLIIVFFSTIMFGLGHCSDLDKERFASTFTPGAVLAILEWNFGLEVSIIAHIFHNLIETLRP